MSRAGLVTKEAAYYAANIQHSAAALKAEKLKIETRLGEIERKLRAADLALDRLKRFQPLRGIELQCWRCWMDHERVSDLRSIGGGTHREDFFRCDSCGLEISLPA